MTERWTTWKGVVFALLAAVLFGLSTPLAKTIQVAPVLLAGLLYLGSGAGLGLYRVWQRARRSSAQEPPLHRRDWPWLGGAILCGGVMGPALLMWGLARTPASSAALLLNVEGVFTALCAWIIFREHVSARIAGGMALLAAGGACLSWSGRPLHGVPWGATAILGACLAWGVDNNLTRQVSGGDPVQIAMLKGWAAGIMNTTLGLVLGAELPRAPVLITVAAIGCFGYGVSLTFFVLALRHLGTARTGAYFSIAPFVGAAAAVTFLGEAWSPGLVVAAILMGLGVWLHLTERHEHWHHHEALAHEHLHVHDEHHQHVHSPQDPPGEPHSHPHRHQEMSHAHPHYPDLHHRHKH